jgi:translation initiation factor 2 alpha subunit (eIF-2alpha)
MRHVATICNKSSVEEICRLISWPLFKTYGWNKTYDLLRRIVQDGNIEVLKNSCPELNQNPEVVEALMVAAGRKLTPQQVRVRALFEVTCYSTDGVVAIRESVKVALDWAVKEGGMPATGDGMIVIKLISAPQFLIETSGIGKEACTDRIMSVLQKIQSEITARGGNYRLRSPPDVIGDDEEALPKFEDDDVSSDEEEGEEVVGNSDSDDSSSSDDSSDDEQTKNGRK